MVTTYKIYNSFLGFFFFFFNLWSQCLYKRTLGNITQAEGTIKYRQTVSHYLGVTISFHLLWRKQLWPKAISLAQNPHRPGTAFPGSLVQPGFASCNSRSPFPLFCQSSLPETNPISVCSRDSHSLCQETCESDAFIFEGMCLCRKPTPIRVTLTQVYSNLLILRGGVARWKDFLGYIP